MAVPLPPWLDIRPEQFTNAAIAGGEQGYRAAGQAGELAQRSALTIAQMAQEAAARSAEIRLRREQIQAELARNAANVAAARYNAALDFEAQQNALGLAREREQNAVAEHAAQLAARQQMAGEENALKRELGLAKIDAGQTFAPSDLGRLISERDAALAQGDVQTATLYDNRIKKLNALGNLTQTQTLGNPFAPSGSIRGTPEQVSAFLQTNQPPAAVTGTNLLTNPNDPLGLFR